MKKLLTLASIACLLVIGAVANSQIICEWNLTASIDPGTGLPVQGGSGTYHVVLVSLGGNSYGIAAYANNDGNAATSLVPGTAAPPGPIPKSGVGKLSFNFSATGGGLITTTATNATNTANLPYLYGGFPNNFGGPNNVAFGTAAGSSGAGNWGISGGSTLFFNAADETFFLTPHADWTHSADGILYFPGAGGNLMFGYFNLDASKTLAGVSASFQDSGQQYTGTCGIVPEGSALAMVLPGLVPLGFLMRRRRMKASA